MLSVGPKPMSLDTWSPVTAPEAEEMWVETDPEMLWQQHIDDHVWENTGEARFVSFRKNGVISSEAHATILLRT